MNRRRHPSKRPSRHRRRLFALQGLGVVCIGAVAWRLAFVQHAYGPRLTAAAEKAETVNGVLLAPRGALLDDQGRQLAYDIPAYTMDVNLAPIQKNLGQVSSIIARSIGDTSSRVSAFFSGYHSWVQWPKPIQEPAREQILAALGKAFPTRPVGDIVTFTPTEQRFYPNGVFASNVIGYVNGQSVGQSGLEEEYNQQLTGQDGSYSYTVQANGFPVESTYRTTKAAHPGDNIKLTIDQTVQGFVEQEMNQLVKKYKPAHAAIIVMDPKSGAILAMSSRPTFDPNNYAHASLEALSTNWAVNSQFEPGSTFKPIVLAAALAENKISLNQTFMSGHTTIDGVRINDWNYVGWKTLTFLGALEKSSNVGFATIAEKLGWPDLMKYIQRFGYADRTGIDLPNEADSILFSPSNRGPVQLATAGFGQGNAYTPLQQMMGIAAIANGGTLYKPYLAQGIVDGQTGKVVKHVQPTIVRSHVVPPNVASEVNQAMIDDVNNPAGIDLIAQLPGYQVAGKTGTAQIPKPTGGYYSNRFRVSFIGYAPGWDPQYEVMVTVDYPKTPIDSTWGSTIAAPTARDILKECLQYYHVQPRNGAVAKTSQSATLPKADTVNGYVQLPDMNGESIQAASAQMKKLGLVIDTIGTGTKVNSQWPDADTEVAKGTTVFLATGSGAGKSAATMPNLIGTPMRLAGEILATLGLNMNPQGTGFVVKQSIAAGQPVSKGLTVNLTLSPSPPAPTNTPSKP